MAVPQLEFDRICKRFSGVVALDDVSFSVPGGSVHALVGENGAGKSTLLKALSGEYQLDSGVIRLGGAARRLDTPRAASAAGVAVIHQELQLAPELSVEENLFLGVTPRRGPLVDRRAMRSRARQVLARLGEDIDPAEKVKSLPIGRRQLVEIGKALVREANVIAFDEPTSSLSARETEALFGVVRNLRADGATVLYVTHRMEEIFELCDGATVLRDGRHVATHAALGGLSRSALISQMAGRPIEDVYGYQPRAHGETEFAVDGLMGQGLAAPANFSVRRGEIVGFFGLVGAGRSELFKLIFGVAPAVAGSVRVGVSAARRFRSPSEAIAAGLAFCSEDRKDEGIIPGLSVRENMALTVRNKKGGVLVREQEEQEQARQGMSSLSVKAASLDIEIASLSGGNQQKVLLARWLAAESEVFLLDEPTRGIDVGARSDIYALLYGLAARGKTIVLASSDMNEVMGVCDRIVVMREGTIAGEFLRAEATQEGLLGLALPAGKRAA